MKLYILNNTLSPSFVLEDNGKRFLVNTPKGFYKNLEGKIDGVILTSDDKYHLYDLEFVQYYQSSSMIPCFCLAEYENEIRKVWEKYEDYLDIKIIEPYKEFEGILPILLHRKTEGLASNKSLGLKINKTLILSAYYSFTQKSISYLDNLDLLLLTVKYLHKENRKDFISIEEVVELLKDKKIKEVELLGVSNKLKSVFDKKYLKINKLLKIK